jgi:hypothetical protein
MAHFTVFRTLVLAPGLELVIAIQTKKAKKVSTISKAKKGSLSSKTKKSTKKKVSTKRSKTSRK